MKRSPDLLKFGSLFVRSYQGVVDRFFRDDRIREAHGFQSYYAGLPPELCPGHMALLSALERRGVYYTRGGMGAIPEALRRLGGGFGMELRLDACVDRIMLSGRRATGVVLTEVSMATPMIYLGVDYEPPLESHHRGRRRCALHHTVGRGGRGPHRTIRNLRRPTWQSARTCSPAARAPRPRAAAAGVGST